MKHFILFIASFVISIVAWGGDKEGIAIIDQFSVNGLSLQNTEQDVKTLLAAYGDKISCESRVTEKKIHNKRILPRRVTWFCKSAQAKPTDPWLQIRIKMTNDRIKQLSYRGQNMLPDIGTDNIPQHIESLYEQFTQNINIHHINYTGFKNKPGSTTDYQPQILDARVYEPCTDYSGKVRKFFVAINLHYEKTAKFESFGAELKRDENDGCDHILGFTDS